jgi:hypothetical protein
VDWFIDDGNIYLVMEYYASGTLATMFEALKKSGEEIDSKVFFIFFQPFFFSTVFFPFITFFSGSSSYCGAGWECPSHPP